MHYYDNIVCWLGIIGLLIVVVRKYFWFSEKEPHQRVYQWGSRPCQ